MKKARLGKEWLFGVLAAAIMGEVHGGEGLRAFKNTNGQTIMAAIVKVAGTNVVIQTDAGKSYNLPVARFSPEDQLYIANWAKEQSQEYLPKIECFFNTGKKDARNGNDYDDRSQLLRPSVRVENREMKVAVDKAEGILMIFGKGAASSNELKVLSKQTFPVNVLPFDKMEWEGKPVKIDYDDNDYARFGYKYNGYLVIIRSATGKVIRVDGTNTFAGKVDMALQLNEGDLTDRNLRKR